MVRTARVTSAAELALPGRPRSAARSWNQPRVGEELGVRQDRCSNVTTGGPAGARKQVPGHRVGQQHADAELGTVVVQRLTAQDPRPDGSRWDRCL